MFDRVKSSDKLLPDWFRSAWRSLSGDSSEVAKRYRERTRDIKRVVSLSEASQTARDVSQLQVSIRPKHSKLEKLNSTCTVCRGFDSFAQF